MPNKRIEAIGHQLKGTVKEGLGRLLGDAKLRADGAAERAEGDAENAAASGGDSLIGIDTDRIKGIGHQIKGTVKERIGDLANDLELMADGVAEREAGKAQNAAGSARDEAREVLKR